MNGCLTPRLHPIAVLLPLLLPVAIRSVCTNIGLVGAGAEAGVVILYSCLREFRGAVRVLLLRDSLRPVMACRHREGASDSGPRRSDGSSGRLFV